MERLVIASEFREDTGFGWYSTMLVRELSKLTSVGVIPISGEGLSREIMPKCVCDEDPDVLIASIGNIPSDIEAPILSTMWEATEIPESKRAPLARFKHIIVPTQWCAKTFRKYHKSVHVVPLGSYLKWSDVPFNPFTFTIIGADESAVDKKRIQEVIHTFERTFDHHNVRLLVKRSPKCFSLEWRSPRVLVISKNLKREEYNQLIERTTVGIQMSCMEGWSFPTNEFMAHGRPVIVARAAGMRDFVSAQSCFEMDHHPAKVPMAVYEGCGTAPFSTAKSLSRMMREAYINWEKVVTKGQLAFEQAARFTPELMAFKFLNKLCELKS